MDSHKTTILTEYIKIYVRAESLDGKTSSITIKTYIIDTSIIDTDGDGWSDSEEQQYGTDPNNSDNYPVQPWPGFAVQAEDLNR
jgi:hypothetical protein